MAQHRRDFTKGPEFVDSNKNLVDLRGTLRLRQRNNNGQWAPYGRYGVGNALIDTWSPKALIELTGFVAEADVQGSDQLLFRLSPDGGATERWWNGAAWVVPTDPVLHWNTEVEIDAHIATFPMGTGISQIARFVSFDGSTTPILIGTSIYFEVQYEPTVDLIDSLARKIASDLKIQGVFQAQVPPTGQPASSQITVDDPVWTLADPVRVFNDTVDPNRRTNLYVSRVGNVLTLAAPQTGLLTVLYTGKLDLTKIHIATDADVEKAELPAIVLQTPTSVRKRFENTFDDYEELLRGLGVIRKRKSATFEEVRVHIQCNAAWDLHGRKLRDAMRSFIEEQLETVRSVALDELLVRTWVGPFAATHDMPEQTASFDVPAVFDVLNWPSHYIDAPLAQTIELKVWPVVASSSPNQEPSVASIETIEVGPAGPAQPGAEPPAPIQFAEAAFDINTPTPYDFFDIPAGSEILASEVIIDTPFDDPGALIAVGLRSSPGNIFPTDAIDAQMVGEYDNEESFLISNPDALRLQVFAGASTQGSGRVVVTLRRR